MLTRGGRPEIDGNIHATQLQAQPMNQTLRIFALVASIGIATLGPTLLLALYRRQA